MPKEFKVVPKEFEVVDEPDITTNKRVSNPIKQGIAGLTDIVTGLPALAGLAGSGIQAGYNTLTGDKGFKENFASAMTDEGIDQALLDAGVGARESVNEALGIQEPVSTEDQAARLVGSFAPIPGLAAAANAGRLARLARGTFNVLTPAVKTGKGFGRRAALQGGIGLGLDQGIRAATDSPLLFSEEAMTGQPRKVPNVVDPLTAPPRFPRASTYGSRGVAAERFRVAPREFRVVPPEQENQDLIDLKSINDQVQREQEWEDDLKFWATIAGTALGVGASAKWARSSLIKNEIINPNSPIGQQVKDTGKFSVDAITEKGFDKARAIKRTLENLGYTKNTVDKVVSNAHSDPVDMAVNFNLTGSLPKDFIDPKGRTPTSPTQLEANVLALGPDNGKLFNEAMIAQTQRATIENTDLASVDPKLFAAASKKSTALDDTIKQARAIPEVKRVMDQYSETMDILLDFQVHKGVLKGGIDPTVKGSAAAFRARATLKDVAGDRLAYAPLYAKTKIQFFKNLARNYFGVNTKQGRLADQSLPDEFGARDLNLQDADELLDPIQGMKQYVVSTMAHATEQSFKGNLLDNLAQVSREGDTVKAIIDQDGKAIIGGRDTAYIGKVTNLDKPDSLPFELYAGNRSLKETFGDVKSLQDLKTKFGDEIQIAHQGGELRVYHVPDKGLRAALDLNPRLGVGLQALSNWKNLFTRFTTGDLSVFAPISGLFSQQQIAVNVAAREGLLAGLKTTGDSFKGTAKLMVEGGSGAIARFLSKRISRQLAAGNIPSEAMIKLERALEKRFINAVSNQVRTESGRTVTSVGNVGNKTIQQMIDNAGDGTVRQILNKVGISSRDYFGKDQLGLVKELWASWNSAWHEGPAYGAMLKHIGKALDENPTMSPKKLAQTTRDAVDISKTYAGDMRRIGTSGFATAFNASVPFSSAMLQSWSSIGSAFKSNPLKFIAGASALIGVPTMSEMAYNSVLSASSDPFPDAKGRMWTYDDYYWNGFTTQQRNDNFIFFWPGKPPWEAILVPVSPEWGLFRATTMEAADAIFNLSNKGDMKDIDATKVNREMFLGSLARVLDLPLPPPLAAAFSYVGMDVRLGFTNEVTSEGEGGRSTEFLRAIPLGRGERITRKSGKTRYAQGDIDRNVAAVIQDIFGAAGSMYINVHEAFMSGKRGTDYKTGTVAKGAEKALDAFGTSLASSARYLQPVLGKALRPNANDEVARNLFASRDNLKKLQNAFNNGYLGGGVAFANGRLIEGQVPIPDDPITLELAASASVIDANIGQLDKDIADIRRQLSAMGNAPNVGTTRQKFDKMDALTLQIQSLKAIQLSVIHDFEQKFSAHLSDKYDANIEIDLTRDQTRPDVTKGLTMRELLTRPQTSR